MCAFRLGYALIELANIGLRSAMTSDCVRCPPCNFLRLWNSDEHTYIDQLFSLQTRDGVFWEARASVVSRRSNADDARGGRFVPVFIRGFRTFVAVLVLSMPLLCFYLLQSSRNTAPSNKLASRTINPSSLFSAPAFISVPLLSSLKPRFPCRYPGLAKQTKRARSTKSVLVFFFFLAFKCCKEFNCASTAAKER